MAAFLRASSALCRQLILYTARNPRAALAPRCMLDKSSVFPHFVSARRLCDANSEEREKYHESEMRETDEIPDFREEKVAPQNPNTQKGKQVMGSMMYGRLLNRIGAISSKKTLMELFDNVLRVEGGVTKLQAYQFLRNCGTELIYESPESRTNLAHVIWDRLIASGMEVDITMYNALLSVYQKNDYNFDPYEVLEKIKSNGLEPNLITITLILKVYGERGDIDGIFKMLEFMKEADMTVTEPVYSSLITAYWKSGDIESAKGVLDTMRENGLEPGHESYTTLLKAYAENGSLEAIDETIIEMQENKIYPNRDVYLTLLEVFGKSKKLDLISKILQKPTVKRLVEEDLHNLMLSFVRNGQIDVAMTIKSFVPVMQKSSSRTVEQQILKQLIESKQPLDVIMKFINDTNEEGVMRNVFETALDASYASKYPELSTAIIKEMIAKGVVVKEHYFYPILASYSKTKNIKDTQATLSIMAEQGFDIDAISMMFVVESFGQPKDADVASVLNLNPEDVKLSSIFLKAIAQIVMKAENFERLGYIFDYAERNDVDSSIFPQAFSSAMKRKFDPDLAFKILQELNKRGFDTELSTCVTEVIIFNCKQKAKVIQASKLIQMMLKWGMQHLLESKGYTIVMAHLNSHPLHSEFENLLQVMKEEKVPLNHYQYNQMLRLYSFQGKSLAAQFCFDNLQNAGVANHHSYSHLIVAYGNSEDGFHRLGPAKESVTKQILNLHEKMKELKLEPQGRAIPYIILSHISRGNLLEANNLKKQYGNLQFPYDVEISFLKEHAEKYDAENALKALNVINNSGLASSPAYAYSLAVKACTGDIDSQRNLLQEMNKKGFEPSWLAFEALFNSYYSKEDIDGALQVLEEAKGEDRYLSFHGCVRLAYLCGKHCPEKLEEVLNDMVEHRMSIPGTKQDLFLHTLAFVSAVSGRTDLEEKLSKMLPAGADSFPYRRMAYIFASYGEVDVILKIQEYLKNKNIERPETVIPLIRAYDFNNDPDGAMEVYNSYIASGGVAWPFLNKTIINLLEKYGREVPFPVTVQRWPNQSDKQMFSTSGDMDSSDSEDYDEQSS